MSKTLSHSAYARFVTCPKSYDLHYNKRLRPTSQSSALMFGTALDKGLNALVIGEDHVAPYNAELTKMLNVSMEWFRNDYDGDLISDEVKTNLEKLATEIAGVEIGAIDTLARTLLERSISEPSKLSEKQRKVLALCCVASLDAKAKLMFEAYKEKVLPRIKGASSAQNEVKWTDEHGNAFVGILDIHCQLDDLGIMPIDNKTSSMPYADDAVSKSPQLALYSHAKNSNRAAFVVLEKNIRKNRVKTCTVCKHVERGGAHKSCNSMATGKRCSGEWAETIQPQANIQIIVGDISPRLQKITLEALSETAQLIKAGVFPRNLNACDNQYGKPCPYRNYCHKGESKGLKVEPAKEPK